MKHLKIKPSFLFLIALGFAFGQGLSLINYLSALILHELAHVFAALRKGYTIKRVTIDVFGMSCDLKEKIEETDSFFVNIAGPAFNLFLCVVCLALYWLFPTSFVYLNSFCLANLVLALFNLIPVYPLDGGKIFRLIFTSEKTYKRLDLAVRSVLSGLFLILFICSIFDSIKPIFILLACFFAFSFPKQEYSFSLFKNKNKKFENVKIVKINANVKIYEMLKKINSKHYIIFYLERGELYLSERRIIDFATKYSLNIQLKDVINLK